MTPDSGESPDDLDAHHVEQMHGDPLYALHYELAEARAEIARHHRDFEAIQAVLDEWEGVWDPDLAGCIEAIRRIVG